MILIVDEAGLIHSPRPIISSERQFWSLFRMAEISTGGATRDVLGPPSQCNVAWTTGSHSRSSVGLSLRKSAKGETQEGYRHHLP